MKRIGQQIRLEYDDLLVLDRLPRPDTPPNDLIDKREAIDFAFQVYDIANTSEQRGIAFSENLPEYRGVILRLTHRRVLSLLQIAEAAVMLSDHGDAGELLALEIRETFPDAA